MSDALKRVVSRAISDAAFRRQLQVNPKGALKEFDLTAAEVAALTSGDATKLTALGIDQRMSRMLQIDSEGFSSAASRVDYADAAGATTRIDPGTSAGLASDAGDEYAVTVGRDTADTASGLSREDSDLGSGIRGADAGAEGAAGLGRDIGDTAAGFGRVDIGAASGRGGDIGTGPGPDGVDLERLASAEAAGNTGVWASDSPYGTDRLERMEGSTPEADVDTDALDESGTTGTSENTPI